jgi:hypothetical protein
MRKKVMLQYRYEKQAEINSFAVFFEQKWIQDVHGEVKSPQIQLVAKKPC